MADVPAKRTRVSEDDHVRADTSSPPLARGSDGTTNDGQLPYTTTTTGIGGKLKEKCEYFRVTEDLGDLYGPRDVEDGQQFFIEISRSGWTTWEVESFLAKALRISDKKVIGFAGTKDKWAFVSQVFSVPRVLSAGHGKDKMVTSHSAESIRKALSTCAETWVLKPDQSQLVVGDVYRAQKKIRRGHLLCNKFEITVSGLKSETVDECRARAAEILEELKVVGWPNYYGEQRFGSGGDSASKGLALIKDAADSDIPKKKRRKLMHSPAFRMQMQSYVSMLFNRVLAERVRRGMFQQVLCGDLCSTVCEHAGVESWALVADDEDEHGANDCRHTHTRSITVKDAKVECDSGNMSPTAPTFGTGQVYARGVPGAIEREVFHTSGLDDDLMKSADLRGGRRPIRLVANDWVDVQIAPVPRDSVDKALQGEQGDRLLFVFRLPAGCYATSLMREFMKSSD